MRLSKILFQATATLLTLSIFSSTSFAQDERRSISILGSSIYNGNIYDYEFTMNANGTSTLRLGSLTAGCEVFSRTIPNFEPDIFKLICSESVREIIIRDSLSGIDTVTSGINNFTSDVFFDIKNTMKFLDDEPQISFLKLRTAKIRCYNGKIINSRISKRIEERGEQIDLDFTVQKVQVEFEDGVIKNIYVDVKSPCIEQRVYNLRFKNKTPISVSSRNDDDRFSDYGIYLTDPDWILDTLIRNERSKFLNDTAKFDPDQGYWKFAEYRKRIYRLARSKKIGYIVSKLIGFKFAVEEKFKSDNLYFLLSELIDYKSLLDVDREDYSPRNCVIELSPQNPVAELRKIKKSRILTSKAFSDFLGFQRNNPNGLVQSEVSTKFLLNTKKTGENAYNMSLLGYVEPKFVYSKIEYNNRDLIFNQGDLSAPSLAQNRKVFETSPVNIFRHQRFSFDVDMNALKFNVPRLKSNFRLNFSAGVNQLISSDTINVVNGIPESSIIPFENVINNWKYGYTIMMEVKPERRFGIHFAYDWRRYNILNSDYIFGTTQNVLHTVCTESFLKTHEESNSTVFFRTRLSFSSPIQDSNFLQIQIGCLFDIFRTKIR
jgi:hypothetical protein